MFTEYLSIRKRYSQTAHIITVLVTPSEHLMWSNICSFVLMKKMGDKVAREVVQSVLLPVEKEFVM